MVSAAGSAPSPEGLGILLLGPLAWGARGFWARSRPGASAEPPGRVSVASWGLPGAAAGSVRGSTGPGCGVRAGAAGRRPRERSQQPGPAVPPAVVVPAAAGPPCPPWAEPQRRVH